MDIQSLLDTLGYSRSQGNWMMPNNADSRLSHQFRLAEKAGVLGCYVYHTSLGDQTTPPQPAVYVASANNDNEARQVQKRLFCLGGCPFLIIILPNAVRAYTCFRYNSASPETARIGSPDTGTLLDQSAELQFFRSEEIDSGRIWNRLARYLGSETRVDYRLLNNLRQLSSLLKAKFGMSREVAHALIGKYIYFHYLRDRSILDNDWLQEHHVQPGEVFGREANHVGFKTLAEALQSRFNGDIFPIPFEDRNWHTNGALPFLARIFEGDTFRTSGSDDVTIQLALDFQAYDFSFIPVELLSSIYEQFLNDEERGEGDGVVYTPEPLADYLLSEMEAVRPLKTGFRILDPCCGSGVFLVLAYRRLIELVWGEQGERPTPTQLSHILTESIFGVEKDREACQITAFSLLLTLLSHLDPPELKANDGFQFPTLVGRNIFHADFFDDACPVFASQMRFHWIAGNPPWSAAKAATQEAAIAWMAAAKSTRKVGGRRLDEAFTWRSGDLLDEGGCAGLLVMATTLINPESSEYRKGFFAHHAVRRITNFSNLRRILFMGAEGVRAEAPAACIIYTDYEPEGRRQPILHFGPFVANQVVTRSRGSRRRVWTITIYDNEIQEIEYSDAIEDTRCLWKTALWGSFLDHRTLQRLRRILPDTFGKIIDKQKWTFGVGQSVLADVSHSKDTVTSIPRLRNKKILDMKTVNKLDYRFVVPDQAISPLPKEREFIHRGHSRLDLMSGPHVIINATLAVFSELDFVIPAPQVGVSGPSSDSELLKAVALYLNSSIAKYLLFFNSAPWGITISKINPEELRSVAFPVLEAQQVKQLAAFYDDFAAIEQKALNQFAPMQSPLPDVQSDVDTAVETALNIPEQVSMVAREFMDVRYQLLEGKSEGDVTRMPSAERLTEYAEQLRLQVDDFAQRCHRVSINFDTNAISATVELTQEHQTVPVSVSPRSSIARAILDAAGEQHSQWVYVQRSVRIFDGPRVHIIKSSRLLDWTRTQAILDAGDIISEVLDKTSAHA